MPSFLERNSTFIGIVTTGVTSLVVFAFTFGNFNSQIGQIRKELEDLQGQKASETKIIVEQHERRITMNETRLDKLNGDIAEMKSDLKVVKQILEQQKPKP